jgi:hypothetical protein
MVILMLPWQCLATTPQRSRFTIVANLPGASAWLAAVSRLNTVTPVRRGSGGSALSWR